jgi:L-ascorbate metabolism protein UlaG (beta-lactamase superfamily)
MTKSFSIDKNTFFEIRFSHDKRVSDLQPFIKDLTALLAQEKPFDESVKRVAEKHPDAAAHFVIDSDNLENTFKLKNEFTFQEWIPDSLIIKNGVRSFDLDLTDLSIIEIQVFADFLHALGSNKRGMLGRLAKEHEFVADLLNSFRANKLVSEDAKSQLPIGVGESAAVVRLQHASLLYQSGGTGILVDPHLHSTYDPGVVSNISRLDIEGKIDAILISHSHLDHWWLSTLMMFPKDIPIVVPNVPASTIICCDMASHLRKLGFVNVKAPEWYSDPICIGDFEVHVLPFYGEQPLLYEGTRDARLRNWGNTYVLRCPRFTSWFLIDSGKDAAGDMLDVARHVKQTFGRVDFLLSNLRQFTLYTPFYINGGSNWLTLTPAQMMKFHRMKNHCITLGPENVARICKAVEATYFLPYAHWWGEVGESAGGSFDIPAPPENGLLYQLDDELKRIEGTTEIIPWKIGEAFTTRGS